MKRKFIEEKIFYGLMVVATAIILMSLLLLLWSILMKGLPSLSWEMITSKPKGGFYLGKSGGVLNAIAGSFYLAGGATLVAFFVAVPVVLYMNVYKKRFSRFVNFTRLCFDVLW